MMLRKGLMIILDGLGDRPSPALGGHTPLEAAATPHMDRMTAAGLCGFVNTLAPWVPVGTQTGTALLMGLARADIKKLTRGPIEATGVGLPLHSGDVALRCNFATLETREDGFAILDRRAGRITMHTDALTATLDGLDLGDGITAHVRPATQHRAVLVLSGDGLSDAITDTDPGSGHKAAGVQPCRPRLDDPAATRTAQAVNTFLRKSYDLLTSHPVNQQRAAQGLPAANGLITRGAGSYTPLRNLIAYLGLHTTLITGESTLVGLARLFGFMAVHEPAFTADPHTNLAAKVRAARQALNTSDLVFLHIKGTDTTAHDLQPEAKRAFIEQIDAALAPLRTDDLVLGITGDHSTASTVGAHTGDPVPACLYAPDIRRDGIDTFGETACMRGGLGHLSGTAFLCAMLDHMGRLHNFQAHEHVYFLEG